VKHYKGAGSTTEMSKASNICENVFPPSIIVKPMFATLKRVLHIFVGLLLCPKRAVDITSLSKGVLTKLH
jgi:hypothetical protein